MEKVNKYITQEELIQKLSHIENVVKDYKGRKRRYYRMKNTMENKEALLDEAMEVMFPDQTESLKNPDFVDYWKEIVESKMENWDGVIWIRTILI